MLKVKSNLLNNLIKNNLNLPKIQKYPQLIYIHKTNNNDLVIHLFDKENINNDMKKQICITATKEYFEDIVFSDDNIDWIIHGAILNNLINYLKTFITYYVTIKAISRKQLELNADSIAIENPGLLKFSNTQHIPYDSLEDARELQMLDNLNIRNNVYKDKDIIYQIYFKDFDTFCQYPPDSIINTPVRYTYSKLGFLSEGSSKHCITQIPTICKFNNLDYKSISIIIDENIHNEIWKIKSDKNTVSKLYHTIYSDNSLVITIEYENIANRKNKIKKETLLHLYNIEPNIIT